MRTGMVAAGLGLLLALAACSGGPGKPAGHPSAPTTTGPSAASKGTATAVPAAPPEGGCYRLRFADLPKTDNADEPVACRRNHTAQTFHVGVRRPSGRHVARVCRTELARFLGGTAEDRRLSRFHAVWFRPSPEQADQGARWFRCDVVAFSHDEQLLRLPPPRRLQHVLARPRALARYGLCGTAAPGAPGFARVICERRHRWRAVATIMLRGGQDYPGARRLRRAGDERCRDIVRSHAASTLRFRYGWEWPTRDQWEAGQRHGYCWAPSR